MGWPIFDLKCPYLDSELGWPVFDLKCPYLDLEWGWPVFDLKCPYLDLEWVGLYMTWTTPWVQVIVVTIV